MNTKQKKIVRAIFAEPTRADIHWPDVEALFIACGATLKEGRSSRVRVFLNDQVVVFHRPHPGKIVVKAAVKDLRLFLINAGIRP
jgi:hypothetical protein